MAKRHKPHAGSLAYIPRKRAKKETPRLRSWPESGEQILGFAGYKAGMTHVIAVDDRKNSATNGMEVFVPVTVIEAPPMYVAGIRFYTLGYTGLEAATDVWAEDVKPELRNRVSLPEKIASSKKISEIKGKLEEYADIMLIVSTQPKMASIAKKKPDVMEIALGGTLEAKLEYAESILGKEVNAADVIQDLQLVDVIAVTKGKGFQGVVKRYGIKLQPRKATKKRRHTGSGGSWTPSRKLWTEPLPGQMGYHTRTEYNKIVLKVGENGEEVTPSGGFLKYGTVKGNYILLKGSVPGPAKRLIRLTQPKRPKGDTGYNIIHIDTTSKQGA